MRRFLETRPELKYAFFGGKGGVGKTVMAGATALWLAGRGRRTLLASTNPVHSLSGLLAQNVAGGHTAVTGAPNLWAYEIDTRDTIERSKREIREKIQWFLKFADVKTKADEFVESATMNPAFEESAMFENMVDLMLKRDYEAYVFDTAPTANARRLLGMSKVYALWVEKMLKSRQEARSLREMLSFTKKKEEDPLLEYLLQFRARMGQARQLLTDATKTAFFFVTLPEALPIAVITRFIGWFHEFGIPVGGVIVNMVLDRDALGADVPEFVQNRLRMQQDHLETIREKFGGSVRAVVPLFDQEVRGVRMLGEAAAAIFSA
jgi:arsenite-transporting ATPase